MTDIGALERRIAAAFDRIARRIEQTPEGDDGEALRTALAAEAARRGAAEAALEELRQTGGAEAAQAGAERQRLTEALDAAGEEAARLRLANDRLRASNRALREANAASLADPELVDHSIRTELEALRTVRDADRAELDAILAALAPLAQEEAHA